MEMKNKSTKDGKRESFASKFGFIMSTAGFAIGLGNIWRFPYITGMNGGGAFVLIYIILTFLICIPLFTAEISLGRQSKLTPIAGMRKLTKKGSPWVLIGWCGVLTVTLIMSYYVMIMGWVFAYLFKVLTGQFSGAVPAEISQSFDVFAATPSVVLPCSAAVLALIVIIVTKGLKNGIEKTCKVMMPALFIFLVILGIRSLTFPGAMEGLKWYLSPDFSVITPAVVLSALGQAFYSVGVGMATAFVYGSYLDSKKSDIPGSTVQVVGFDTFAAILAGIVIFPALFSFGLEPNAGPGLLFVTMVNLFTQIPAGNLFGGAFFFLIFIASITSGIGLLEAIVASAMDSLQIERKKAVWLSAGIIFALCIPVTLSFSSMSHVLVFGKNIFELFDYLSGNILLTFGGLLIALYTAFTWKFENFKEDTNMGSGRYKIQTWWKPFVTYIIPVAVLIIFVTGII